MSLIIKKKMHRCENMIEVMKESLETMMGVVKNSCVRKSMSFKIEDWVQYDEITEFRRKLSARVLK